jgi:PRTRC genetic system protein B
MSFEINDLDSSSVKLQSAILLYGSHGGYDAIRYATIHPVDCGQNGAAPVIRAGRPADRNSLKAVVGGLMDASRIRSGVLPDNILSTGTEHIVWWQRPAQRTYFFKTREGADDAAFVGTRSGLAPTPGLVFVAKGQRMEVYAVKGDARPDAATKLFHAPLMNVYDDGRICTGSMPLPDSTVAESVVAWEKSFWESNFSHPNHPKPVNYKGGIHAFSSDLLDGKFRKFPMKVLRAMKGMTLGALVDRLDGVGAQR